MMQQQENLIAYLKTLLNQLPQEWLKLTTHRLDIYNEDKAKTEFTEELEKLYRAGQADTNALRNLPTAYDYIRLGHPLSSLLEWALAKLSQLRTERVIAFSSQTMPVLAVLRHNKLVGKKTRIITQGPLPKAFDPETLRQVYGYQFDLITDGHPQALEDFDGSTLLLSSRSSFAPLEAMPGVDFHVQTYGALGSLIYILAEDTDTYIGAIQHVRRRESIAMTPADCHQALLNLTGGSLPEEDPQLAENRRQVQETIAGITATEVPALLGSCGLSVQYGIMMGLIEAAKEKHPGKAIEIIVPPNCYGGTNDQARRVAAAVDQVSIMDLPVDGDNDMVQSTQQVLDRCAELDAVPLIIAEIPTNPRVEVPDLAALKAALSTERQTPQGEKAVEPVFILDQTFCPNVQFLGEEGILSMVPTISYVSGSKFPSGGKCTAGYCVANEKAAPLMESIDKHMTLCDNKATALQTELLAEQMPSMNQRIAKAYQNTRYFVNFIKETLPSAKINFVSEELAEQGFTPSVFSLDLPTKGAEPAAREAYKRELNLRLISMMINQIPEESKYCVSYGQLKGCYWTIPATSTQGTTKEEDKDYIARVSVSPDLDLEQHKEVFAEFVESI